jgi:endonuclease-3
LSTSARARDRIPAIMRDLRRRYLPAGDLRQGNTALAKISARTEDPFRVLIGTILSQRTRDEMTEKATDQLFAKYPDAASLARADTVDVERLIRPVGFYHQKAPQIQRVSRILLEQYGGRVPSTYEELMALPQVGSKTANCVLVYGFGIPRIPVDTHVHRVSNRLGLVTTKAPEKTEAVLMAVVPRRYWLDVNELFIEFGKETCRPIGPRCDACSFTSFCRHYRVVVSKRRPRSAPRRPSHR